MFSSIPVIHVSSFLFYSDPVVITYWVFHSIVNVFAIGHHFVIFCTYDSYPHPFVVFPQVGAVHRIEEMLLRDRPGIRGGALRWQLSHLVTTHTLHGPGALP